MNNNTSFSDFLTECREICDMKQLSELSKYEFAVYWAWEDGKSPAEAVEYLLGDSRATIC